MERETPERILERIQQEEVKSGQGKLKIFFGYAAGVGKTYAMLEAAQTAKAEGVDVVCGPLLTLLLFTRSKTRKQLLTDAVMILALQATALAYGVSTAWNARPVYLVAEVDRFKVITWEEIHHADFSSLPTDLRPGVWKSPTVVALRPPASIEEKNKVLFESLQTGRDYAERPEFYIPYNAETAATVLGRAREATALLKSYPQHHSWLEAYARAQKRPLSDIRYLPVMAREDWVAIVTPKGQITQFLKGDGFL